MKKELAMGMTLLAVGTLLAGCGNSGDSSSKTEKAKDVTNSKVAKKSSKKKSSSSKSEKATTIPTDDKHDWFFKDDVFYAGMETYRLTKSEIRDSVDSGKKVLVIYTDITNNSDEEQDPSNVYMVVHAKQKTDTSNISLDPGMIASDENGDNPLQEYEDNLNNALLPGKTVTGIISFELVNDNPVSVEFDNEDFDTIGTKEYQVK